MDAGAGQTIGYVQELGGAPTKALDAGQVTQAASVLSETIDATHKLAGMLEERLGAVLQLEPESDAKVAHDPRPGVPLADELLAINERLGMANYRLNRLHGRIEL